METRNHDLYINPRRVMRHNKYPPNVCIYKDIKSSVRDFKTLNIRLILNFIHKNESEINWVWSFVREIGKLSGGTEKCQTI